MRNRILKSNQDETVALLNKLTEAISYKYKGDAAAPNITISKIPHGYYCSVVRYIKGTGIKGGGKVVVCKTEASTLESALEAVVDEFLNTVGKQTDPIQELSSFINR